MSDSIVSDPDLSQLSDVGLVRARFGDQPKLVAAVERVVECRETLMVVDP